MDSHILVYFIQFVLIFVLLYIMVILLKLSKITRLEKRIDKYTLNPLHEDEDSLIDELMDLYYKYRKRLSNKLSKSKLFKGMDKRYVKYIDKSNKEIVGFDYVADKVIFSFVFLIIVIVTNALFSVFATISEMAIGLLVGFYLPDVILLSNSKIKSKTIENDLLKAITIMNNSFKSGNSIMQAIKIVTEEIDGPLKAEFDKMYVDLSYGLSLDVVFKRFSKRVNTEEVKYMTTSLTILNKTGGNVKKVFSTIENNFFERRKLSQELRSIRASSVFMFRVLILIPFAISMFIIFLNPTYFEVLYTTPIGFGILFLIIFIYLLYIVVIRKVMDVEGLK